MYSVFLADDEHIVLEGIRNRIAREGSNFSFAGEASDGELALSMIHEVKPDILVTDIKMPFMDGLELARIVKKNQPWIRIIILSGHDEFEYAKKAIKIGVEDYILKPFTPEELEAALEKAADNIEEERRQLNDMSRLKEELESTVQLAKNKFLTDIVLGTADFSSVMDEVAAFKIQLAADFYKVLTVDFYSKENSESSLQNAKSRIAALFKNGDDAVFFISKTRFVCILMGNDQNEVEDDSYAVSESIVHITEMSFDCSTVISIGKTVDDISKIQCSYNDADKIFSMAHIDGKSRILSSDDIQKASDGFLILQEKDPIASRLKFAGRNEIDFIISKYLDMIKRNSGHFAVIASSYMVDFIMGVKNLVEELGGNINEVAPEILEESFVEKSVQNEETFVHELRKVLEVILSFRDERMQGRYGDVILRAKEFIQNTYKSQDTCLSSIAKSVFLSPNHFSTIFSQACGITFIEYLTNMRIEEAKKLLLNTNMKGADIAYECGFSDPHYFSYIFKKNTGFTPSEFKSSVKNQQA